MIPKNKTKLKLALLILALIFLFGTGDTAFAQGYTYTPMEEIPGFGRISNFPAYILAIYQFGIWTVGIAAMLMIIIGGFMYMTAAGNTSKAGTAKTVITDAIYGLIVALSAYLLLFIINPDLVGVDISMSPMTTRPSPPTPAPPSPSPTPPGPTPSGSGCSRVISSAQTMMARGCLYDQSRRNGCTGNPGYTDCSDLVDTSYRQAGCSSPGNNSATIGSHGQPIGDSNSLRTGDVLAVPGHVVMCVSDGCRTVIGASGVGRDIRYSNGSYYINQGATVVRASNYCSSC